MTAVIPLCVDFQDETVLVFGGGPVGARKARRFAREARVVVVSPAFADASFGDAERVVGAPDAADVANWIERTDPALVVAATDDGDLNEAIATAARDAGALVNRADRSGERPADSVVVPATVRDDPVTVAVATGGRAPALSKFLRERLAAELDGAGAMARLAGDLRTSLRERDVPAPDRRRAIRAVVRDPAVWTALRTGDANPRDEAEATIAAELDERSSPGADT